MTSADLNLMLAAMFSQNTLVMLVVGGGALFLFLKVMDLVHRP